MSRQIYCNHIVIANDDCNQIANEIVQYDCKVPEKQSIAIIFLLRNISAINCNQIGPTPGGNPPGRRLSVKAIINELPL